MCLVDKQKNKRGGRQGTVGLLFPRQAKRRQATMFLLFVCYLHLAIVLSTIKLHIIDDQ